MVQRETIRRVYVLAVAYNAFKPQNLQSIPNQLRRRAIPCFTPKPKTVSTPVCSEKVTLGHNGLLDFIQREGRQALDPNGERWKLFDRESPTRLSMGSLIRVTFQASRSTPQKSTFTGVLLAVKKGVGNPTMLVRGIVDDVGVEQVFSIFSPLIENIELLKAPDAFTSKKLYRLREHPDELQAIIDSKKIKKKKK